MKNLATLILSFFVMPLAAHANFESTMKAMGKDFKVLNAEAKTGSFQPDALAYARDLANLIHSEQTETPDSDVLDPNDAAKKADFYGLLKKLSVSADALVTALQNGDQAAALQAFNDMASLKQQGHDAYKPED